LTKHFGRTRTKFIPIPDPAPDVLAEENFNLREQFNIPKDRRTFLFFGAISKRKGADVLIEALQTLRPEFSKQCAFIFCGEPESSYKKEFQETISKLRGLEVRMENTFVSDERMVALFEQVDVILTPYTRPEYSSGILSLAAKAGTPVLGPEGGLLGRLIEENGLGATTPVTPAAVAEALTRSVSADPVAQRAFAKKASLVDFAETILDSICNES